MVKKRGLGKSLDALLAYSNPEAANAVETTTQPEDQLRQLSVEQIQRGKYQPRREMDTQALEDLANSIRTQGVIQPLIVRPIGNKFEIIAGERRWRALSEHPEDDAAVQVQGVSRGQNHARRGEKRYPRIGLERSDQSEKLADEPRCSGQPDVRQREHEQRNCVARHTLHQTAISRNFAGVHAIVDDANAKKEGPRDKAVADHLIHCTLHTLSVGGE